MRFIFVAFALLLSWQTSAQQHTDFMGLALTESPADLAAELTKKGFYRDDSLRMLGRVENLEVEVLIDPSKDSAGCNYVLMTTQHQQGISQNEDYVALLKWMELHYGKPHWESTVRSHRFARWFIGYDRDIVMIATATTAVEIWFYETHKKRHIDYYSILKHCERNPVDTVPYYTAHDLVTWHSTAPTVTKSKKAVKRKANKTRRRSAAKKKHRRRR